MYPNGRSRSLRRYFTAELREDRLLELELLILAVATGVGDAATYSEYRVFTANHTGNTIMIAVGTMEHTSNFKPVSGIPIPLPLIAISLAMFLVGGWITGQIANRVGRRQRWWIQVCNFFQMLLIFIASMIQGGWNQMPISNKGLTVDATSIVIVGLLAFSAGGQVALVRTLQMTEITTANATSCYVDLLIDQRLFQRPNRGRNRRLSFLACLSAGSFAGSYAYRQFGSSTTLFISALGKILVSIMLFFNKGGLWARGGFRKEVEVVKSETFTDPDLSYPSPPKKDCAFCNSLPAKNNLSEKTKFDGFDYRATEIRDSSESSPPYVRNSYLDLPENQCYVQIPSWTINAITYVPRYACDIDAPMSPY